MGRSLTASVLFHLALALLVVALSAMGRQLPPAEAPITVEIVTATAEPAPSPLKPAAPPAQAAPLPPRQAASPAPPPPAPKVEPKPEPPPPPKAEPEPEPPPPPKAEPEPPPPPPPPPPKVEPKPAPPPPPKAEPKPEPPPPPKAEPKPAPPPPLPKALEAPPPEPPKKVEAPKPEAPKPAPAKPPEAPKPEKPPEPPAPKQQENDFDALLRSVEQTPKRVQAPEQRPGKGTSAAPAGTGQPGKAVVAQINPSVLAASISRQITPCWNIPVAAQGIGGLRAELNIVMGPDGGIQSVEPLDRGRMATDPVFRAFAESAVRAVRACSPLKLPPESYQLWRNIIFNFDPSQLAG